MGLGLTSLKIANFLDKDGGFFKYCEFRADREALKEAKCSECVEEFKFLSSQACSDGAHATPEECQHYVGKFESEGLLCKHHSKK